MLTLHSAPSDECGDDESGEHDIQLVEAREHPAEALEPPEQGFDLVAPLGQLPVVFPGSSTAALRRHHGDEAEIGCQLPGFIVLTGPVHDRGRPVRRLLRPLQEPPPLRGKCNTSVICVAQYSKTRRESGHIFR